ncbi:hypothetical protein [Bacillus sp. Bos-x628]|uniref:hypothetical protein n=1 Tax=Bacillus maqinnsis TaxID=3229854 RepID=UPI00338FF726
MNVEANQTEVTPEEKVETPEVTPEQKSDPMIPKTRFDEVNAKYKEMADKVAQFEAEQAKLQAEAEAKELEAKKEQGKFEELYQATQKELENFKAYEARAKELESVITGMVETKLNDVPKDMHDLIPNNLSVEQTLDWLNKAESKGLFGSKQEAKEIGKPSNKSNEAPKVDKANLSPLDKILAGIGK